MTGFSGHALVGLPHFGCDTQPSPAVCIELFDYSGFWHVYIRTVLCFTVPVWPLQEQTVGAAAQTAAAHATREQIHTAAAPPVLSLMGTGACSNVCVGSACRGRAPPAHCGPGRCQMCHCFGKSIPHFSVFGLHTLVGNFPEPSDPVLFGLAYHIHPWQAAKSMLWPTVCTAGEVAL